MSTTRVTARSPVQPKTNGNGHATTQPPQLPHNWEALPKKLRQHGHFVVWREKEGQKKPYSPHNPAQYASCTDPRTSASFELAQSVYKTYGFDGIHAVCSHEFTFIDIDDCITNGQFSQSAAEVMDKLPTYWEVSPSGTGVHGVVVLDNGDNFRNIVKGQGKNDVEIYAEKHFMSVTGWQTWRSREYWRVPAAQLEQWRTGKKRVAVPSTARSGAPQLLRGSASRPSEPRGGMKRQGADLATIEQRITAAQCHALLASAG